MTISKLTNLVHPLDETNKINEIIDELDNVNVSIDSKTITKNSSDELQTVGVIDSNNTTNAIKTWTGTKAQYEAIVTKDANTLYNITDDTDVTLSLLNLLYPVGAIYIGTCNACPLQALGVGTWQLVSAGRVLQGIGTGQTAGDTVEAGLPNITGDVGYNSGIGHVANVSLGLSVSNTDMSGAFYKSQSCSYSATRQSEQGSDGKSLGFDASRSSAIYGNSTTVQPPAYIVNIWERVA